MQDRARTHELRRLSQAEADAICARHERLWKARPGGARAVFAWCDLSGLSFKGRNLADADFSASVMHGTDLSGCKLDNANFFGADMQEADLSEASLRRTDLRGACLKGADLSGADLKRANLTDTDLSRATFLGACLRQTDLTGAVTTGARGMEIDAAA